MVLGETAQKQLQTLQGAACKLLWQDISGYFIGAPGVPGQIAHAKPLKKIAITPIEAHDWQRRATVIHVSSVGIVMAGSMCMAVLSSFILASSCVLLISLVHQQ